MTLTPLLDQLDELGDAGADLLAACEAVVDQAHYEKRLLERDRKRALLDERVAAFFADNYGATANDAYREIGGARHEVLDSVKRVTSGWFGTGSHRMTTEDAA